MDKANRLLLLCASPRKQGTSAMLLRRIQKSAGGDLVFLPQQGDFTEVLAAMRRADSMVISGPCYVNSYPARLYQLVEAAAREGGFAGQKLYGIINGGMPYTHTHRHGLDMLSLFAGGCALTWQGGFVLGGGAMLDGKELEKHLSRRRLVPAFDRFIQHIKAGSPSPDNLYEDAQKPLGRLLTLLMAKLLTRMAEKRIRQHGHDPNAPNAYLRDRPPT